MIDNKPLCEMPWLALTITGQGEIKPCCQFKGSLGSVYEGVSLQAARNSTAALELKNKMMRHEYAETCSSCWQREKHIGESRRTWFKNKFSEHFPDNLTTDTPVGSLVQMDLNLANKCNLKCRMCGSWASHLWNKEDLALSKIDRAFRRESRPEKLRVFELTESHIDEILPSLQNIRRIDFKGGEPMLAKAHTYLLEKLIDLGLHQQIQLFYTTNGTILNKAILDLLARFMKVQITISIEAVGPLYSYIRGGKYAIADLLENIRQYSGRPNINVGFNVAVQAYNALYLKDLWWFLNTLNIPNVSAKDAFKYTVVNDPAYLSPWVLPRPLKELAMKRIADIAELQEFHGRLQTSPDSESSWALFCKFTMALDALRGDSLLEVVPEMRGFFPAPEEGVCSAT